MIKYAVARTDNKTKVTTFKINDQEPVDFVNTSSRQLMADWINREDIDVISLYEVLHVSLPKEVVCWYEEHDEVLEDIHSKR